MLRSCRSCVTREATKQLLPVTAAMATTAHPSTTGQGRQGRPGLRVAIMAESLEPREPRDRKTP